MTDERLQEVYAKIKEIKDRFYNSKSQSEWDETKKELVEELSIAEKLMSPDFYPKYKQGVVDSVSKMYSYKQKWFEQQEQGQKKQWPVKQSYILRENEGLAFTRLCNALADYLEKKL